jgi:hypothetical protein
MIVRTLASDERMIILPCAVEMAVKFREKSKKNVAGDRVSLGPWLNLRRCAKSLLKSFLEKPSWRVGGALHDKMMSR